MNVRLLPMIRPALILTVMSLGVVALLSAQTSSAREIARRVPVTVVLADSFPYSGATAAIVRRPRTQPHDVILLSPSSSGAALAAAVMQLLIIRERDGDVPVAPSLFRVREGARAGHLLEPEMATAISIVDRLRTKPKRSLPGVTGRVRTTEIYLPSRAMRDEMKSGRRLRFGTER
jgi:hypothetical protein